MNPLASVRRCAVFAAFSFFGASVATAHPGHGTDGDTALHWALDPAHLVVWGSIAAVALILTAACTKWVAAPKGKKSV